MALLNWPGTLNLLGATAHAAFRFHMITDPNAVLRKTLMLHSGGFLGETIASILILFAFVRQGQISNRLNSQKITLRVITLLSTFLRSYCRNRTWKCVVPRCYEART